MLGDFGSVGNRCYQKPTCPLTNSYCKSKEATINIRGSLTAKRASVSEAEKSAPRSDSELLPSISFSDAESGAHVFFARLLFSFFDFEPVFREEAVFFGVEVFRFRPPF
jgi:hypothetical protein